MVVRGCAWLCVVVWCTLSLTCYERVQVTNHPLWCVYMGNGSGCHDEFAQTIGHLVHCMEYRFQVFDQSLPRILTGLCDIIVVYNFGS